jgi:hypothetical protein
MVWDPRDADKFEVLTFSNLVSRLPPLPLRNALVQVRSLP